MSMCGSLVHYVSLGHLLFSSQACLACQRDLDQSQYVHNVIWHLPSSTLTESMFYYCHVKFHMLILIQFCHFKIHDSLLLAAWKMPHNNARELEGMAECALLRPNHFTGHKECRGKTTIQIKK